MTRDSSFSWRALFILGGLLYFAGAFNHPRGMGMSGMLVDPAWIPSHAAVFAGLLLMTAGLVFVRRSRRSTPAMARWLGFAIVMSVLETVEMGLHTLAYLDADALQQGALHGGLATPILTAHIWFATLVYTPYAVALMGLVWTGQRERSLGSPWIGWLGIVGAVAHGSVMWLGIVLGIGWAGVLFPIAALAISLWFILAGVWPIRELVVSGPPGHEQAVGAAGAGWAPGGGQDEARV